MRGADEQEYTDYVSGRILPMRRTAYRLCGDWDQAHDLVQTTFVQLYRYWRRARGSEDLDAYVRRMLLNTFLTEKRRFWARRVHTLAEPPDIAADTGTPEHAIDLHDAIRRLPPGQRAVVVLRYWEGLDVAATAEALGCSVGNVKSQTSHAVNALRRLLPNYVSEGVMIR